MGFALKAPVVTAVDNSAAITIGGQQSVTKLTKHFDFANNRVRDDVESLRVKLVWVSTGSQTADIFTKPLDASSFLHLRRELLS